MKLNTIIYQPLSLSLSLSLSLTLSLSHPLSLSLSLSLSQTLPGSLRLCLSLIRSYMYSSFLLVVEHKPVSALKPPKMNVNLAAGSDG